MMHVNSAQDWQVQGTVVENDDETGLERVEFCLGENMPKLSEDLSDEDEERAVVLEVSLTGSYFTTWCNKISIASSAAE